QLASLWHRSPLPKQNPLGTHWEYGPQSLSAWHCCWVPPIRPPIHCPVVFGPHVPVQSATLKQRALGLSPPSQTPPTGAHIPPGPSADVMQLLPSLVPPEQRVASP